MRPPWPRSSRSSWISSEPREPSACLSVEPLRLIWLKPSVRKPWVEPGRSKSKRTPRRVKSSSQRVGTSSPRSCSASTVSSRAKDGMSTILIEPTTPEATRKSLIGFLYLSQPGWSPWNVPTMAPALPALQSVSQPAMVAISAVRGRSPSP
ncbi:hypothetical protein D3C71_1648380 [compost metagenome]